MILFNLFSLKEGGKGGRRGAGVRIGRKTSIFPPPPKKKINTFPNLPPFPSAFLL